MTLLNPVKLKNILPIVNTSDILTEEMLDYMRLYLEPTTIMDTELLKVGPPSIESEFDEALAAPDVLRVAKEAELAGYHGIFVNCFGDPGVRAVREYVKIPVFGGFEPPVHLALGLCDKIGIVTVMKNVVPMIRGNIAKAGMKERVVSLRNIELSVEECYQTELISKAIYEECKKAISEDGVEGFVLGCTAMVNVAENVKAALLRDGYDIPVIEAAQAALKLLELSAQMQLKQSNITYMTPPHLP